MFSNIASHYLCTMKDFKAYFIIPAECEEVYRAITNPIALSMWTEEEAIMSEEEGSDFSLWGGNISGKNLTFEKNKKVVQEWFFGNQSDKSIVTLKMHPHKKGTSLEVNHTNIPDTEYEEFCSGWENLYVAGLVEFFEE